MTLASDELQQMRDEIASVRAMLRIECEDLGDNEWSDSLHLADVIEKHLARPARATIEHLRMFGPDAGAICNQ